MRLLKLILSAFVAVAAVIGGLAMALLITIGSLTIMLVRRLLGRPAPSPQRSSPRAAPPGRDDVIEVTATEVRPDR